MKVTAMTETFYQGPEAQSHGKEEPVRIDDASAFLARFRNGSWPHLRPHGTRAATRRSIIRNQRRAPRRVGPARSSPLEYFDHGDEGGLRGWRDIHITDSDHSIYEAVVGARLQIGLPSDTFIHQAADFLAAVADEKSAAPTFARRCSPITSLPRCSRVPRQIRIG